MDVVRIVPADFSDETQGQVRVLRRDPFGSGQSGTQAGESRTDVLGKGNADKQAKHGSAFLE
jgi:hypothetical protein